MEKIFSVILILLCLLKTASTQENNNVPVFNLEECIRSAFERSPQAILYDAQRVQAQTGVLNTLSPVVPLINFASGWIRSGPEVGVVAEVPGAPPILTEEFAVDQFQTSVSVVQNLVDVASFVQLSEIPNINRIADYQFESSRADLAFSVKQQYYNLIILYNNLRVADAAVAQFVQQALVAREQFRLGVIARPEMLRVEVGLIQQRVERINAVAALDDGLRGLAGLIGADQPIRIDTTLVFPDTVASLPSRDSLLETVLHRNPAFISTSLSLEVSRSNERATRLRLLPTISGTFTYGYVAPEIFSGFSDWRDNDFWSFGLQLNWNIFERLGWITQRMDAAAQSRIAEANVETARISAVQEMDQAYANLLAAREALLFVPDLLVLAQEEQQLTSEQFRLGAASASDLLQSQFVFNQAQQQAVSVIINYDVSQAQIQRLLGEW